MTVRLHIKQIADPIYVVSSQRYCKRVYDSSNPARQAIFLTLLKVYLRPRRDLLVGKEEQQPGQTHLFGPALSLLATQGTRMDAEAVLNLIPPLLTIGELQVFLQKSLRKTVHSRNANKVEAKVWRARMDQVKRTLVELEGRRVKITDGRLSVVKNLIISILK